MGARNEINGNYEAICKYRSLVIKLNWFRIGTGFTDELLVQLTEGLKDAQLDAKPDNYAVAKSLKPDVWFLPSQV